MNGLGGGELPDLTVREARLEELRTAGAVRLGR